MPLPASHRFSVADYYRLAEIGVLAPGARVELIEGQVCDLFPVSPFHAAVTRRISKHFLQLPGERCIVSNRNPVRLDEFSEPEPDIALLKYRPDFYSRRHPGPEDVLLLVEVADVLLEYDHDKLPMYSCAGVAEVWIVNLNNATIEVYREPNFAGYATITILRAGDYGKPAMFPDVALDVAELLKK